MFRRVEQSHQQKESSTKRTLIAGVAAAALLSGTQAFAQTVVSTTVELAPEQRTTIKEYVVKERVRPVTIRERVSVGATLPADVELAPVPQTWGPLGACRYRYVYS